MTYLFVRYAAALVDEAFAADTVQQKATFHEVEEIVPFLILSCNDKSAILVIECVMYGEGLGKTVTLFWGVDIHITMKLIIQMYKPDYEDQSLLCICTWMSVTKITFSVNSHVSKTVRHGTSLHRICPKLLVDSSPSQLKSQTYVRWPTVKLFDLSPIWLESQASIRRPTLKLFCSSPIRLESQASVCRPSLKLFGSSTSRLSFDRCRNCWLTS